MWGGESLCVREGRVHAWGVESSSTTRLTTPRSISTAWGGEPLIQGWVWGEVDSTSTRGCVRARMRVHGEPAARRTMD